MSPFISKKEASQLLKGQQVDRLKRVLTAMSFRSDIGDGWEELLNSPRVKKVRVIYSTIGVVV